MLHVRTWKRAAGTFAVVPYHLQEIIWSSWIDHAHRSQMTTFIRPLRASGDNRQWPVPGGYSSRASGVRTLSYPLSLGLRVMLPSQACTWRKTLAECSFADASVGGGFSGGSYSLRLATLLLNFVALSKARLIYNPYRYFVQDWKWFWSGFFNSFSVRQVVHKHLCVFMQVCSLILGRCFTYAIRSRCSVTSTDGMNK